VHGPARRPAYHGGVTAPESTSPRPRDPSPRELTAGRVAAVVVFGEAVALLGIVGFYLYELLVGVGDPTIVVMSAATMVIFVIGLVYTAKGLHRRHPRAQAPAIAMNFLLVPLGLAMFGFAPWWLAGAVLAGGVVTIVAVLLMGPLEERGEREERAGR
jgi:hypothetical protein